MLSEIIGVSYMMLMRQADDIRYRCIDNLRGIGHDLNRDDATIVALISRLVPSRLPASICLAKRLKPFYRWRRQVIALPFEPAECCGGSHSLAALVVRRVFAVSRTRASDDAVFELQT